jgi:hypothetical protein
MYWRNFNVTPGDRKPSEVNFKRSFGAQFTDPSEPDLLFRQHYTRLNELWASKFGWPIFRALHEGDGHILKQFRVPLSDSLGEFDNQLLYLVKMIIDSLNEEELAKACSGALPDEKGISKFKRFLEKETYPGVERDVTLLRNLQDLRSSGAVHHKGKQFDKVRKRVGLDSEPPRTVFRMLLLGVNDMLTDLLTHIAPPATQAK